MKNNRFGGKKMKKVLFLVALMIILLIVITAIIMNSETKENVVKSFIKEQDISSLNANENNNSQNIVKEDERKATNNFQTGELLEDELKIAGIALEMKKSEVIGLLGNNYIETTPDLWDADLLYHSEMIYSELGLSIGITYEEVEEKGGIIISEGIVETVKLQNNASTKAIRNLGISSTKEDILKAFESTNILKSEMLDDNVIVVGINEKDPNIYNAKIEFILEDEKVIQILLWYGAE